MAANEILQKGDTVGGECRMYHNVTCVRNLLKGREEWRGIPCLAAKSWMTSGFVKDLFLDDSLGKGRPPFLGLFMRRRGTSREVQGEERGSLTL